jgi:hypothetical protein
MRSRGLDRLSDVFEESESLMRSMRCALSSGAGCFRAGANVRHHAPGVALRSSHGCGDAGLKSAAVAGETALRCGLPGGVWSGCAHIQTQVAVQRLPEGGGAPDAQHDIMISGFVQLDQRAALPA